MLLLGNFMIFSMEITEHNKHQKKYIVPPLQQLCAEVCTKYTLNYAHITQPCKDLIKQHQYYQEPLTPDTVEKVLLAAHQRGDALKLQECRSFRTKITLTMLPPSFIPEDPERSLLPYDQWQTLQESTFKEIIEKTTMTNDPDEFSILINDPEIRHHHHEYIKERNSHRRLTKCYYRSLVLICPISLCVGLIWTFVPKIL